MSVVQQARRIVLADDDQDDRALFQEVLDELPLFTQLQTVFNGEQLIQWLNDRRTELPDILFLDLNLPRKNGFECLTAIKRNETLKTVPVIIFTTSNEPSVISLLYNIGAHYYIRKPNDFCQLKKVIHQALILTDQRNPSRPSREDFVLSPQSIKDEIR